MSLREYISDITEAAVTIAKGMRITWHYGTSAKEETTIFYPEERMVMPERTRGWLFNDMSKCIACNMCVKQCPIDCITLETIKGADKKNVATSYKINMGRCMLCGLCVEICPPKSLTHTDGYEGSAHSREELIVEFVKEDLATIKARIAAHAAQLAKAAKEAEAAGKPAAAPANPAQGEKKK